MNREASEEFGLPRGPLYAGSVDDLTLGDLSYAATAAVPTILISDRRLSPSVVTIKISRFRCPQTSVFGRVIRPALGRPRAESLACDVEGPVTEWD